MRSGNSLDQCSIHKLFNTRIFVSTMRRSALIAVSGILVVAGAMMILTNDMSTTSTRRNLAAVKKSPMKRYKLTEQVQTWCRPPLFPPLDYTKCNSSDKVVHIPFMAGLTNGLKMLLLEVTAAYEENKCLFVTENPLNQLLMRDDSTQQLPTILGRYFEPIGLRKDDPLVRTARKEKRLELANWRDVWDSPVKRRIHGHLHNITSLGYEGIESTSLKKIMLQRMWRLQPKVRDDSCSTLESHGLEDEYLAFSVRRGDKDTEGFEFTKPNDYIVAAEEAVTRHFGGIMPKIFVATDDCAVMPELRALKPNWQFTSECDRSAGHNGFILEDMRKWTLEQTDEHYRKFFVELIGLAGAKFYIGVAYTNVAWWAVYMRPFRWSHHFLDLVGRDTADLLNNW